MIWDNKDITMLKTDLFANLNMPASTAKKVGAFSMQESPDQVTDTYWLDHIHQYSTNADPSVIKALKEHKHGFSQLPNGLILHDRQVYVPINSQLCDDLLHEHHDTPIAGHPGWHKTHELITCNYWWPTIAKDCHTYVTGCETCQYTKPSHQAPAMSLHPHSIPSQPWECISFDLITNLPVAHGYDAILVFCDLFSKSVIFVPMDKTLNATGFTKHFVKCVFSQHGLPCKVISNHGSQFTSSFWKDVCHQLGITCNLSTAFHPQTDGQTEYTNQELEQYLCLYINHKQDNWPDWLPLAEFCHNNHVHSATGHSPFELTTGYHPFTGSNYACVTTNEAADDFVQRIKSSQDDAKAAMANAQEMMACAYDRSKHAPIEYHPGNQVHLKGTNIHSDRPVKKLDNRQYGPFKVDKLVGLASYCLHLPKTWKTIHPVFHESLLIPYMPPSFCSST